MDGHREVLSGQRKGLVGTPGVSGVSLHHPRAGAWTKDWKKLAVPGAHCTTPLLYKGMFNIFHNKKFKKEHKTEVGLSGRAALPPPCLWWGRWVLSLQSCLTV